MFRNKNTFASNEDQLRSGKYTTNKVPPYTDRRGPPESCNTSYNKSNKVRLLKTKQNKYEIAFDLTTPNTPNVN